MGNDNGVLEEVAKERRAQDGFAELLKGLIELGN
jgi:hypothetical protein